LNDIDTLIRLNYGTYTELAELTPREIRDIFVVIKSKQQEEELTKSRQNQ
jgi:hypothetical protein